MIDVGVNDVAVVGQPIAYGTGLGVALLVVLAPQAGGSIVTVAHEGGHMFMAALTLRGHSGFEMDDGNNAGTTVNDVSWGVGDLLVTFAGYVTPPLLGLGGALLVARGAAWSALACGAFLVVLSLVFAHGRLATTVTAAASAGVVATLLFGSAVLQAAVAVVLVWWLLFGGVRTAWRMSRGERSDAYWLARRTLVPRVVWYVVWVGIALACLVTGGRYLLVA